LSFESFGDVAGDVASEPEPGMIFGSFDFDFCFLEVPDDDDDVSASTNLFAISDPADAMLEPLES
jgi:hypothetical protein